MVRTYKYSYYVRIKIDLNRRRYFMIHDVIDML